MSLTQTSIARISVLTLTIAMAGCTGGNSGGAASSQTPPQDTVKHAKPAPGGIVVYGDSLAVGTGSTRRESTIAACLEKNFSNYTATTQAQIGATTRYGLQNMSALIALKPKVVVISLGGNDVLQNAFGSGFSEIETFDNLQVLYRELTSYGIMVVQLGLNPPDARASRLAKIKDTATREGVLFVPDILEGMWNNTSLMSDSIHPNDAGYELVCERVVKSLLPVLR